MRFEVWDQHQNTSCRSHPAVNPDIKQEPMGEKHMPRATVHRVERIRNKITGTEPSSKRTLSTLSDKGTG